MKLMNKGVIIKLHIQVNPNDESLHKLIYYMHTQNENFKCNIDMLFIEIEMLNECIKSLRELLKDLSENGNYEASILQKRWEMREKQLRIIEEIYELRRDFFKMLKFPEFEKENEFWEIVDEQEFRSKFKEDNENVLYYDNSH